MAPPDAADPQYQGSDSVGFQLPRTGGNGSADIPMHGQGTHGQTKQTALHYYELDAIHNVMDLHVLQLRRLSAGGLSRIEGLKVETPLPSNGLEELVDTLSIGVPAIASISQRMAKI